LGLVPIDPDGDLVVLHVGEIGNLTGAAVVESVRNSDSRGLKGPRLLLSKSVTIPDELQKWIRPISGCDIQDVLWTADFNDKVRTIEHFNQAGNYWLCNRHKPMSIRIQYDALMCLAIAGTYRVLDYFGVAEDITNLSEPFFIEMMGNRMVSKDDLPILASYCLCAKRAPFTLKRLNDQVDSFLTHTKDIKEIADIPICPYVSKD
jgi:hypothetical protein